MKLIKIILVQILIFLLFSCKYNNYKEIESFPKNEAYLNIEMDDTLILNKVRKVQIKFAHSNNGYANVNQDDLKIVSGCLVFSTEQRLAVLEKEFDIKCDSIFSPSVGIKDTVSFKFNYKPSKLGRNFLLLKLNEKNYLNPHKDSVRMINYDYVIKKEFFVLENK